jgi:hypothetical protein
MQSAQDRRGDHVVTSRIFEQPGNHGRSRKRTAPMDTYKARDLIHQIAEATWICGDPGMQFDTTVNDWHTCPNTARINASNPLGRTPRQSISGFPHAGQDSPRSELESYM